MSARVLLLGAYGQDNLGDEAILEVHLQRLAGHPLTVVSSNPRQTQARYDVPSVQTYGGDRRATVRAFRESDAVIFGGGSLVKELKPPYFRHRLVVNLAALGTAAKVSGKGVAYSAMGVERLPTRTARFLARRAANASDLFLVRDPGSRDKLQAIGARREAHVTADPAYLLETDADAHGRAAAFLEPFGDRPVVVLNPIRSSEVACSPNKVARSFAALADHVHAELDAHVLLMPFKTAGPDRDTDLAEAVRDRMANPEDASVTPRDLRPSEALALLARADAFAGMRHHGVLLALLAGCPTVAVPYAEKTTNLTREFGIADASVPAHLLEPEALVDAFREVHAKGDAQRVACAPRLEQMQARALENFDRLHRFLESRGAR